MRYMAIRRPFVMKSNHLPKFALAATLAWLPCGFAQLAPFAPEGSDPLGTIFSADIGGRFTGDALIGASPLLGVVSHRSVEVAADDFTETPWSHERLAAISARLFSGDARMLLNRAFFTASVSSAVLVEADNFVSGGLLSMNVARAIKYTAIPAPIADRD